MGIQANLYNYVTLYYTLEHVYNTIIMVIGMLWSAGLVLRTCAYKWISAMTRLMPGSGSEDCCKNSVRYEKQLLYKCKNAF